MESNNIAIKKSKTLLAVSGGIDSVVLAHLFNSIGLDFGIAHCNFNLRGKESNEDEEFVKNLAASLNNDFHVTSFQTSKIAKSKGISIQMTARDLRYNWFEHIRSTNGYHYIATAHHKGDVVETVLFNLTKGAGLEGLHGIKAVINKLVRPLLFASRIEIESYAKQHNIKYREDSSNTLVKYSRNKIRHQVIPILEEINPKAQDSIYYTSEKIKEVELFLKYNFDKLRDEIVDLQNDNSIVNVKSLMKIPGYKYILFQILKPFGFTYLQSIAISNSFGGLSGKLFYSRSHVANVDRGILIVSSSENKRTNEIIEEDQNEFNFGDLSISTNSFPKKEYTIEHNNNILAIDKAKLQFPLEIRQWEKGDVFQPLGMDGKKKLSDFMIDAKIPVNLKKQIRVILSGVDIVGILEHRLDNRFKITEKTQEVFEIRVINKNVQSI